MKFLAAYRSDESDAPRYVLQIDEDTYLIVKDDATFRKWMEDLGKRYEQEKVLLLPPDSFTTEEAVAQLIEQLDNLNGEES